MMMSNKHETALALIDEQIEREEQQRRNVEAKVMGTKAQLKRDEDELRLIDWSLEQLKGSRSALTFDRAANSITEEPSEVP
jgi:hypothetical protein